MTDYFDEEEIYTLETKNRELNHRIEELEIIHVESPNYGEAVKYLVKMEKKYKSALEACRAVMKDRDDLNFKISANTSRMCREVVEKEDDGTTD